MSKKRKNHSTEFKSKVALVAIMSDQSLTEFSAIWHQQQSDREVAETTLE